MGETGHAAGGGGGWQITRELSIEGAYSFFDPGPFIEETGPAKVVHFVGAEVQLRY